MSLGPRPRETFGIEDSPGTDGAVAWPRPLPGGQELRLSARRNVCFMCGTHRSERTPSWLASVVVVGSREKVWSLCFTAMVVGSTPSARQRRRTVRDARRNGGLSCVAPARLARVATPRPVSFASASSIAMTCGAQGQHVAGNVLLTLSSSFAVVAPATVATLRSSSHTGFLRSTPCSRPVPTGLGPTGHRCKPSLVSAPRLQIGRALTYRVDQACDPTLLSANDVVNVELVELIHKKKGNR